MIVLFGEDIDTDGEVAGGIALRPGFGECTEETDVGISTWLKETLSAVIDCSGDWRE